MSSLYTAYSTFSALVYTVPVFGPVSVGKIIIAGSLFIGLTAFFFVVRKIILVRLHQLAKHTETDIDDTLITAIKSIKPWVYSIVALFAALQLFTWPSLIDRIILGSLLFALLWQAIQIAYCFLDYGVARYARSRSETETLDGNAAMMTELVRLLAGIVLWTLGGLFILANVGINVTSLIAGLGIGGIAIAFALQGILADLFASFSIYFDRPFRIGDFIVVGQDKGTVEKIGIKSTRIRTLQGEELVISNAELTTARVQNFKRMDERRVVMQVEIAYETPYEKVASLPQHIREAFAAFPGGRLDRVFFTTFGPSALIFEIVYYIESADMVEYLTVQEQFNLQLLKTFTEEGIAFAYPTQTIYTKAG